MKYKLVIFDLDGTLVDIPIHYEKIRKKLGINKGERISDAILGLNSGELMLFREYNTEVEKEVNLKDVKMLYKTMDIMSTFAGSVDLGLVTFQGFDLAVRILKHFNWFQHIEFIVTRENITERASVLCRIEQLNYVRGAYENKFNCILRSQDMLFVGNAIHDFEAAREIGCFFLGV